jgi:nitrogen fixation NifU-like protein
VADVRAHGINPVCGDELEITARRHDGKIAQVRYAGHGCVISQASAAMMAEALEGQSEARARELVRAFKAMMLENAPVSSLPEELEPLSALEGVRKFPLRVKCATLGWNTIAQGLESAPAREA